MSVQIKNQTTGNWEKAALGAKEVQDQIGNLANLNTTAKTNLVAAINEVAQNGGGGGSTPVMQGATASTDGRAGSAPKPFIADRNKALFGDGRYHNVSTGAKSAVIAYVTNDDFIGETVTLTDGSTTITGTIGNDGEYMFDNLTMWGPVQLSCTHSGDTIRGFASISYYGNYIVKLTSDFSTLTVTTTDATLYGKSIDVLRDNKNGELLYGGVFSNNGVATIYIDTLDRLFLKAYDSTGVLCTTFITIKEYGNNYSVYLGLVELYGFEVDLTNSDPETCMSVPSDCINYGYTNARMDYTNAVFDYGSWTGNEFFFPRPCMLNFDGTVAYYLDPNDYSKKADGTASDIADPTYNGNVMMEFPTIYFKRETNENSNKVTVYISNRQVDEDYYAYAHHDKNGNILENIYMACYDMSVLNGVGRSLSGRSITNDLTRPGEVSAAQACNVSGETGEGWYIWHKADYDMVRDLALLISGTLDSQTAFGNGVMSGSPISSGQTDNLGLFYGYTVSGNSAKIFGIENFIGNSNKSVAGWCMNGGTMRIKMTYGNEDGSNTNGYNYDGTDYYQFPKTFQVGSGTTTKWYETKYGYIPWTGGGSTATYTCDYVWTGNNGYTQVGGSGEAGNKTGIFFLALDGAYTRARIYDGAMLTYKGLNS